MFYSLRQQHFYRISSIFIISLVLLSSFSVVSAQRRREEPPPLRERLFFGGNVGLSFGTVTDVQVAPIIGLWILPRVAVAAGPNFRFYKDPYDKTDIYGIKTYGQFVLVQDINNLIPLGVHTGIFAHMEYEWLNLETSFWQSIPTFMETRFNIHTLLAGGGISQQLGPRSSINFTVLWALNDPGFGVYSNPEIRLSFNF